MRYTELAQSIKANISILLICLLLSFSTTTNAHPGGHHHDGEESTLKIWTLANGKTLKGSFSMGKNGFIVIEELSGKMTKIITADLIYADQQIAYTKVRKFDKMNEEFAATNATANILPATVITNPTNNLNYLYAFGAIALLAISLLVIRAKTNLFKKVIYQKIAVSTLIATTVFSVYACKSSSSTVTPATTTTTPTTTTTTSTTIPKTTTAFMQTVYGPLSPAVSTRFDDTYFYISCNGLPTTHNMMVGITNWQQQVPTPQAYTGTTNSWSIPLQPVYAATPLSTTTNFMKGAVAVAANGIPIFNALNNRGADSFLIGELDNWGGHCGKADDYHYHAAPLHLSATTGLAPIAMALDGFAVYGAKEPDGTTMQTLDTSHGHVYNGGVYHYHGTADYPYVIGAMKGVVAFDPATTAPENQILPQAFASPLRPPTDPLAGARITAFASTGTNAYKLTYTVGTGTAYIDYSWTTSNAYTFRFTSATGAVTTANYQR